MPKCDQCGRDVETVAILHLVRAFDDRPVCRTCFEIRPLTSPGRREVVAILVETILVHPGRRRYNRFDASRVQITPRQGTKEQPG